MSVLEIALVFQHPGTDLLSLTVSVRLRDSRDRAPCHFNLLLITGTLT